MFSNNSGWRTWQKNMSQTTDQRSVWEKHGLPASWLNLFGHGHTQSVPALYQAKQSLLVSDLYFHLQFYTLHKPFGPKILRIFLCLLESEPSPSETNKKRVTYGQNPVHRDRDCQQSCMEHFSANQESVVLDSTATFKPSPNGSNKCNSYVYFRVSTGIREVPGNRLPQISIV